MKRGNLDSLFISQLVNLENKAFEEKIWPLSIIKGQPAKFIKFRS